MQPSPVQTRSIVYRRVAIEPHRTPENQIDEEMNAFDLEWNGIRMEVATGTDIAEENVTDPALFAVSMRLQIQNVVGKICPYKIDVELLGLIRVNPKLPAERREALATVNGLAIVYGAARELITNITSRMEYGPLVLPGVNFQDQVSQPKLPQEIPPTD
jgi:preprotein translocase subunit SecB